MSEHGDYIVIEGGEGSGKDTQKEYLAEWIREEFKQEPLIVHEPYDDPIIGPFIAELLEGKDPNKDFSNLDYWQQTLLMTAARRGIARQIVSGLREGMWVLSSRNYMSTIVYQGRTITSTIEMDQLHGVAVNIGNGVSADLYLRPDLVLLIDVDPILVREQGRLDGRELSTFERKPIEFHQQIREAYLREANKMNSGYHPVNVEVVDGSQTEQEVFERIIEAVSIYTKGAKND